MINIALVQSTVAYSRIADLTWSANAPVETTCVVLWSVDNEREPLIFTSYRPNQCVLGPQSLENTSRITTYQLSVDIKHAITYTSCAGGRHNMPQPPVTLTFDLLTLKVVSKSRDVGYLCANFSLPRPLCSRLRPNVRDRQTDRQTSDSIIA